jgi:hypothetical protein
MGKIKAHDIAKDFLRVKKDLGRNLTYQEYLTSGVFGEDTIKEVFGGKTQFIHAVVAAELEEEPAAGPTGPKILIFDIETAPMLAYVWGLFDQNIGLNQIHSDWHLLSVSAKWLDAPPSEIMYLDQRSATNIEDDKALLEWIWKLIDEADILVTQNGKRFDVKKLNARFVMNGMQPPSSFKHIDTLEIAKRKFAFTSNKLEYMTDKLCTKYKKKKSKQFNGFELWRECLKGNLKAWREMEKYNKYDVLSLEELYRILIPWHNTVNLNLYNDSKDFKCSACDSIEFIRNGWHYLPSGRYQRFRCKGCGTEYKARANELSKAKKESLKTPIR